MKVGSENKKTLIVAAVLGVVAIFFFIRMLSGFGGGNPSASAPPNVSATNAAIAAATQPGAPAARTTTKRSRSSAKDRRVTTGSPVQSLDPRLNMALLEQSEKVAYSGTGRNIFKMEEEPPPLPRNIAPAEIAQTKPERTIPQAPMTAQPIPLKFYGWASKPGEPRSVFLSSGGGDVFVAKEGEIVNRRYKIVRIQPNTVEVEDMLTNNHQNLPLSQG